MITGQDPETMIAFCTQFLYYHSLLNEVHLHCFVFMPDLGFRNLGRGFIIMSLLAHLISGQDPRRKILRIYHRSNYFNNDYRPRPGDNDYYSLLNESIYIALFLFLTLVPEIWAAVSSLFHRLLI